MPHYSLSGKGGFFGDSKVNVMFYILQKHDKPKFVLCVAFAENGDVISGDSNGNIFIWPKGLI